jgi:hypothetical protein
VFRSHLHNKEEKVKRNSGNRHGGGFVGLIPWRFTRPPKVAVSQLEFLVATKVLNPELVPVKSLEQWDLEDVRITMSERTRTFLGRYPAAEDRKIPVSQMVQRVFMAQGLDAVVPAVMRGVLADAADLKLRSIMDSRPVYTNLIEKGHSERFFLIGQGEWTGELREGIAPVAQYAKTNRGLREWYKPEWVAVGELFKTIREDRERPLHLAVDLLAAKYPDIRSWLRAQRTRPQAPRPKRLTLYVAE